MTEDDLILETDTQDKRYQLGSSQTRLKFLNAIQDEIQRLDQLQDVYGCLDEQRVDTAIEVLQEFHDKITSNEVQI